MSSSAIPESAAVPEVARASTPQLNDTEDASGSGAAPGANAQAHALAEDGTIDADDDSAYDGDSSRFSNTTSITSSIYKGYMKHGRRYQSQNDGEYWAPSDEKQLETWSTAHVLQCVLDSQEANPFFRSPLSPKATHILDIGTGEGSWAMDVADAFPNIIVHAIDRAIPPKTWVPPNLFFEIDDATLPYTLPHKFDLVHIRWLLGSCTPQQWKDLYAHAYEGLAPGGWIEQVELSVKITCDDGTLPADSELATWGDKFEEYAAAINHPFNTMETMRARIEEAGFVNVHEKRWKVPIGDWPKQRKFKDAGRLNDMHFRTGMEGFVLALFSSAGWEMEQMQAYLTKVRGELDQRGWHKYVHARRVYAMKPIAAQG